MTLPRVGSKMYIRAKTTNDRTGSHTNSAWDQFVMTGKIAASQSVMYLLKKDGD